MANDKGISGQNDYHPIWFKNLPSLPIVLALNQWNVGGGAEGGDLKHISKMQIISRILKIWKHNFLKIALNQEGGGGLKRRGYLNRIGW